MKGSFDYWLNTEEGKRCNDFHKLSGQPYLQNRLWRAYEAGKKEVGINEENVQLMKQLIKLKIELNEAKYLIKRLTKKIKINPLP